MQRVRFVDRLKSITLIFLLLLVTTKWLAQAHQFERDFALLIQPVVDFISKPETAHETEENDEEITDLLSNATNKEENSSVQYLIKPDWRIVLTHPTFGVEYRKYIRKTCCFFSSASSFSSIFHCIVQVKI